MIEPLGTASLVQVHLPFQIPNMIFFWKKLLWFNQRACTTVVTPKCTHAKVATENDNGYKKKEDFNLTDLIIELVIIFHIDVIIFVSSHLKRLNPIPQNTVN